MLDFSETWEFSKVTLVVTFALFLVGMLFALGQTLHLGFEYFNTFGYSDFIRNTVIATPLIIVGMLLIGAASFLRDLYDTFLVPFYAFKDKSSNRMHRILAVTSAAISILLLLLALLYIIISSKYPNSVFDLSFLPVFAIIMWITFSILNLALKRFQTPYREAISEKREARPPREKMDIGNGLLIVLVMSPVFGAASIQLQSHKTPDSEIIFSDGEVNEVNILATNSNAIAVFSEGKVEIINRSQIKKIIRLNTTL